MYKLLVVDDERLEREAVKYIVGRSDLMIDEIEEASNGQEAVTMVAEFDPDIVTLDIRMPGLDGIEAGKLIKALKPEIKIVFVTAYERFDYAHEAIKIGVEDFIVKPGTDQRTISILQRCIDELEEKKQQKLESEAMSVTINQISGFLENEFVRSVVGGDIDEKHAEDYLKFMLNEFIEGFGTVIKIDFTNAQETTYLHKNLIMKRFIKKLSTLSERHIGLMFNQVKDLLFVLVFDYKSHHSEDMVRRFLEDKIQMAGEDFKEQYGVKVFYSFGRSYDKVSLLWKSFAQAKVGARNMSIEDRESCNDTTNQSIHLDLHENELCQAILQEEEQVVMNKADYILDHMIFSLDDINGVRLKLYELIIFLNKYLNKESQTKHAIPDYLFDDLKNIDSRSSAKNYIHVYLLEVLESIKQQNIDKEPMLVEQIKRYIDEHLGEGITLEEVAYEIGFSRHYFGKIFKKAFDMTFTEYLTNKRIEYAKKYLGDERKTVKDVTYEVGYMDPNYFTRVFKKLVGVTPTEYRAQVLGKGV